jgi:GT2 family glycosyltransferase
MSRQNIISIVIPNYNRKDHVLEALQSVYEQQFHNFEVIVVDDNSSDGSVNAIRKRYPQILVVAQHENKGPAVARNIGIRKAHGSIIVGIDSDVVLQDKQTLARIASQFAKSPGISCIALRILNYYDHKDDAKTWWHPFPIADYAGQMFYTDYFSGSGYAFQRVVFEQAGYYPEELFMHGEENDLALRILDSGFDILYCPFIKVLHKASRQSRVNTIPFYYKRRNQIWVVAKYYPFLRGLKYIVPRLGRTFVQALLGGQLALYCKALFDSVRKLPVILKTRKPLSKYTWRRIDLIRDGTYAGILDKH